MSRSGKGTSFRNFNVKPYFIKIFTVILRYSKYVMENWWVIPTYSRFVFLEVVCIFSTPLYKNFYNQLLFVSHQNFQMEWKSTPLVLVSSGIFDVMRKLIVTWIIYRWTYQQLNRITTTISITRIFISVSIYYQLVFYGYNSLSIYNSHVVVRLTNYLKYGGWSIKIVRLHCQFS